MFSKYEIIIYYHDTYTWTDCIEQRQQQQQKKNTLIKKTSHKKMEIGSSEIVVNLERFIVKQYTNDA